MLMKSALRKKIMSKETKEITIRNQEELLEPEKEGKKLTLQDSVFSDKQLLRILQRTPKEHIYTRPGKGGGTWEYTTGTYTKKSLNYIFGWMWSSEVKSTEEKHGQIVARIRLTIHKQDGSSLLWKEDTGRADIKYRKGTKEPMDYGNDEKAAITDGLKRCAAQFGIASDVYGKQEFKEVFTAKEVKPTRIKEIKSVVEAKPIIEFECLECAEPLTKAVADYSKKVYGKILCKKHQKPQ
jgi:hypothetical protein